MPVEATTKFGKICSHSAFGPRFSSDDYALDGNVATLRTTDIGIDGRIDYSTMPIARLDLNRFAPHILKRGDLVITRTGRVGTTAVFSDFKLPVVPGAFLIRFRLNPSVADSQFYRYFFNSKEGQALIASVATGSVQQNLNIPSLHGLDVPLPHLAEQKAIASVLGVLDDKIELNRRMNATLEATVRALFQSWFVDFEPVRAKLDGRVPVGLSQATAAMFPSTFQTSSLGLIPTGWEVKTADEISTVGIGKTPPRKEHQWFSENTSDVPWMSIRDLGDTQVFISQTSEFLTAEAVETFHVRRIPEDTVVLSFKLTMGRVAITDREMLSNEAIAHFRLNPETPFGSAYLYCYLKGFGYDQLGSTSSIATAINSDMVRAIRVLIPPREIAEEFERTVKSLFAQVRNIQRQSSTLAALRDTLLPKLLSGELRVDEAERGVSV